jgi:hypothetical protein
MEKIKLITAFESVKTTADMLAAEAKVVALIKDKKILPDQISIRDVFESCFGSKAIAGLMEGTDSSRFLAREAVAPVNLSAFTNITGNLLFEAGVEAYKAAMPVGDSLVTAETSRRDGGRDIGLALIDDDAMIVEEGEEYPDARYGEDYVDIPTSKKRGLKIGLTREVIFFDETAQVLTRAREISERLGTNKEKRILRMVLGVDNNYKRNGVALNTYTGAGNRINLKGTTALVDWTSLDAAEQMFADMKDDRVNPEPVDVQPNTILVPKELSWTARRIFTATELRTGTNGGNTQTYSPNMLTQTATVTTPWFKKILTDAGVAANVASARWYYGDFKRAFRYRTLFPFQFISASHDKDEFERDVVAQFRVSERGVPRVVAPWYVGQFNAA